MLGITAIFPDNTAADAVIIRCGDINNTPIAIYIRKRCTAVRCNHSTFRVVADRNERQSTKFAIADLDVLITNVEGLLELVPNVIELVRIILQIEVIVVGH